MKEFFSTLFDGMKHAFDLTSVDNFLSYVLNILNEFGAFAQKFFNLLP